ncbi:MAG TPA: FtsX-like permease family protein [bacterium]|nr:FtsX-like permease family protein [bacterium]HPN31101.1 FtsX-like permease family protein [bacterium]
MNPAIKISLRNLYRQKRRNLLLGIAIAFGMAALVTANSFSNGISDVLLNKIVVYIFGHMNISVSERGNFQNMMIRDKKRLIEIIQKNVEGIKEIEEGVGGFGRIIGNGKSDNIALAGVKPSPEFYGWCKVVSGNIKDYENKNIENPILLSEMKAKYLNVGVNDILRLRTTNVWGQTQTARLTVAAIVKLDNIFMENALYLNMEDMKKIMGYRPYETGVLLVNLNNPLKSIEQADRLHKALSPEKAFIQGRIKSNDSYSDIVFFPVNKDSSSITLINNKLKLSAGCDVAGIINGGAIITNHIANTFNLKPEDKLVFEYKSKFEGDSVIADFQVKSIVNEKKSNIPPNTAFVSEKSFFPVYYDFIPKNAGYNDNSKIFADLKEFFPAISDEWQILKRTGTTEELQKKIKDIKQTKTKIAKLDVRTMHESASAVLKLESALNIITVIAVLVLFFIILIGVVNTLRMSIKERTREIGTIRSIGMQKKDVKTCFLLETFFLTLLSCITGIVFAFILMYLLKFITFENSESIISILLVDKHLHFLPNPASIIFSLILILFISLATAYFPARRAANLKPSDALRHF